MSRMSFDTTTHLYGIPFDRWTVTSGSPRGVEISCYDRGGVQTITFPDVCGVCDVIDVGDSDRCNCGQMSASHNITMEWRATSTYTRHVASPGYHVSAGSGITISPSGYGVTTRRSKDYRSQANNVPDVPDSDKYAGAVRAWRLWYAINSPSGELRLRAWAHNHVWRPGVNTATGVMSLEMAGGFYGFNDYNLIKAQEPGGYAAAMHTNSHGLWSTPSYPVVIGSYLGWGHIVVAEHGMRARNAKPEYVVLSGNFDWDQQLLTLADYYGMKAISEDQAKELKTGLVPFTAPEEKEESSDE